MTPTTKKRILGEHFREDGRPKRKFLSQQSAERFVREREIDGLVVYYCTFCQGWHLATEK